MKLAIIFTFALGALATGCSITSTSPSSSSSPSDSGGPVAAQPLAGNIDGQSWTAKIGIARAGFSDGKKSIDIYDAAATCDSSMADAKRKILIDVPWSAGTSKNFSFSLGGGDSQTGTFVINGSDNIISTAGRVEVVDAPTDKGSTGKIRLRMAAESNTVEGEVSVLVCE